MPDPDRVPPDQPSPTRPRPATTSGGIISPLSSALPPMAQETEPVERTAPTTGHGPVTPGGVARAVAAPVGTAAVAEGEPEADTTAAAAAAVAPEATEPDAVPDTGGAGAVQQAAEPVGAAASVVSPPDEGRTADTGGRGWLQRRVTMPWAVLAAVAAAVVAIGCWGAVALAGDGAVDAARTSALQAAGADAAALATYQYQHLDHDFGVVEARSTPSFRRSFRRSSQGLVQVLTQYHARATADVLAVGLTSVTTGRAVALVFLNQTVSNTTQTSGPTVDESRVEITLVRSGGRWLIDRVRIR